MFPPPPPAPTSPFRYQQYMKSFIAKRVISILVNLRYLRFKLLKYIENNKKICNTFDHNFKNIPLYIMSNVSLERYYFVSYDGALTLKISKMALNAFCDKTLHILLPYVTIRCLPCSTMKIKSSSSSLWEMVAGLLVVYSVSLLIDIRHGFESDSRLPILTLNAGPRHRLTM